VAHGPQDRALSAPPPGEDLIDWRLLRDCAGFVVRAVKRHSKIAAVVVCGTFVLSLVVLKAMPKTWHVEARILAQRNQVMPALGNPQRAVPSDADAPTRAASETVMSRDNLVALIKQTDLLDRWDTSRAPLARLKDSLMRAIGKAPTDEDKLEALVGLLEKRLTVESAEGTVNIALDWPDGHMAYRLVEAAQQSFIEARHVAEVSTIAEAISILESHAAGVRRQIDDQLAELRKAQMQRGARQRVAAKVAPQPLADEDTARLYVLHNAKKRALEDLEEFRRKRLAELQARLVEVRGTFAEGHPNVHGLQQSIAQLQNESPQTAALRRESEALSAELKLRGISDALPGIGERVATEALVAARSAETTGDPGAEVLRDRLANLLKKFDSLQERVEAARIELDTARAAFKYRYAVVRPAQAPKQPVKPNPLALIAGGILGGLLLGVLAAVAVDLRGGRIVETWQAERMLDLPLLGEVRAP
jgi:uncharacterized protein involved in exopolysaccharide biosynthesis